MRRPTQRLDQARLLHPMMFWGVAALVHGLLLGIWLFGYQVEGELQSGLAVIGVLVLALLIVLGLASWRGAAEVQTVRRR